MSKVALALACCAFASLFAVDAQAFSPAPVLAAKPEVLLVRGFCGLGAHRGPYGGCVPNGVPYGYVAPVVVMPPAMVAPRIVCPYGYYYYVPYGRCVPTP
jgi:hypothetical protein